MVRTGKAKVLTMPKPKTNAPSSDWMQDDIRMMEAAVAARNNPLLIDLLHEHLGKMKELSAVRKRERKKSRNPLKRFLVWCGDVFDDIYVLHLDTISDVVAGVVFVAVIAAVVAFIVWCIARFNTIVTVLAWFVVVAVIAAVVLSLVELIAWVRGELC